MVKNSFVKKASKIFVCMIIISLMALMPIVSASADDRSYFEQGTGFSSTDIINEFTNNGSYLFSFVDGEDGNLISYRRNSRTVSVGRVVGFGLGLTFAERDIFYKAGSVVSFSLDSNFVMIDDFNISQSAFIFSGLCCEDSLSHSLDSGDYDTKVELQDFNLSVKTDPVTQDPILYTYSFRLHFLEDSNGFRFFCNLPNLGYSHYMYPNRLVNNVDSIEFLIRNFSSSVVGFQSTEAIDVANEVDGIMSGTYNSFKDLTQVDNFKDYLYVIGGQLTSFFDNTSTRANIDITNFMPYDLDLPAVGTINIKSMFGPLSFTIQDLYNKTYNKQPWRALYTVVSSFVALGCMYSIIRFFFNLVCSILDIAIPSVTDKDVKVVGGMLNG